MHAAQTSLATILCVLLGFIMIAQLGKQIQPRENSIALESNVRKLQLHSERYSPLANELADSRNVPENDLQVLGQIIQAYYQVPTNEKTFSSNLELTQALTKSSGKLEAGLPKSHPSISPDGELVDRWQTPYSIRHLTESTIEIRSAGSDRQLYTADDLLWPRPQTEQAKRMTYQDHVAN